MLSKYFWLPANNQTTFTEFESGYSVLSTIESDQASHLCCREMPLQLHTASNEAMGSSMSKKMAREKTSLTVLGGLRRRPAV